MSAATLAVVAAASIAAITAIDVLRSHRGASAYENFEYLAVRATQWERRHPTGAYPAGLPRMKDL